MRIFTRIIPVFLLLVLPLRAQGETVSVSAAASLREVLSDIAHKYEAASPDKIDLNFGASGTLAAQIQRGAGVDLFISAGVKPVDDLVAAGIADSASRYAVAGNRLVLIVPRDYKNPPAKFEDLADPRFRHVAIGEPKVVPAGQYAMQTFKALKLESSLSDRLVMGENVRQVLVYVMRGEADAGVVYATDAAEAGDAIRVVATADESTHDPIQYPAICIKSAKQPATGKFMRFLKGDVAHAAFAARGFTLPVPAIAATTEPVKTATTRPAEKDSVR